MGVPLGDASINGMDGSLPDISVGSLDGGIANATMLVAKLAADAR
jgi:hypothetical protein